ncbi:MAG: MGMT family protein [Candidatus Woesearchaeota archaeon]
MTVINHPFGSYVPSHATLLILGSFPPVSLGADDFFYASRQNQFWKIITRIYGAWLPSTWQKQMFCEINRIAMADLIHSTRRAKNDSSDQNLEAASYTDIQGILKQAPAIKRVVCTSTFVKERFEKHFAGLIEMNSLEVITLPSPSPRYARMSFERKVEAYEKILTPTFTQKVYTMLLTIPKGRVTTYKAIAEKIGCKAYRAVGQALNKNPFGIQNPVSSSAEQLTPVHNPPHSEMSVPCHRVISNDRTLGGFATGLKNKRRLLEREGIRFDCDERVCGDFIIDRL